MFLFGWKRQRTGSCCLLPFPAAAHPRCLGGDALKDSSANGWQRSKRLCLLCPLWCLRSRQPFRPWPHACKKKKRRPCAVRRNCSWNQKLKTTAAAKDNMRARNKQPCQVFFQTPCHLLSTSFHVSQKYWIGALLCSWRRDLPCANPNEMQCEKNYIR